MGPDDERRTLYVSPHIERLLGYSRQEWLDQPDIWTELLHPDDRESELAAHDHHSRTGEPWAREYRLIAADGQVVWVRDQATLAVDGEGSPDWQGELVDVTSQHVRTELLTITNEHLERIVAERTSTLEEANELMGLEIAERRRVEKDLRNADHTKDAYDARNRMLKLQYGLAVVSGGEDRLYELGQLDRRRPAKAGPPPKFSGNDTGLGSSVVLVRVNRAMNTANASPAGAALGRPCAGRRLLRPVASRQRVPRAVRRHADRVPRANGFGFFQDGRLSAA